MKVAFFHGLESKPRSFKNECLEEIFGAENVYAPAMDYRNPEMFDDVLYHLKHNHVDLLIGSSMGGWFAHKLSTLLDVPVFAFNPAMQDRSFEPKIQSGNDMPNHTIVLGKQDVVVDPIETCCYFTDKGIKNVRYKFEDMGHRIPDEIFEKHMLSLHKK
jgi:predicted esterase YcpF (UPF0227 family)